MKPTAFVVLALTAALGHAADKPSIVYILADDLGWKDVGFHGSNIKTPNIDKLAAGGTRLEQFYAQPMCTPTRAALMTGRYPLRYGLQTLVIPDAGTYGLATDEWLLPQALKEAGYTTAIIGKWHLGHAKREYWPRQRGFDYQYGPLLGEIDYFTQAAHGRRDWFRDNKPVVFHSDNGGPRSASATGVADTSKLKIPCDNGPYRDGKTTVYEGGTRVVTLANWPGRIKPGGVVDQPIHVVDMYPTLAGLAGASLAKTKPLDGVDVWPVISEGKPSPRKEVVYNVEPFVAGIREGDWKLVWRTGLPSQVELFNVAVDPSEKTNVADQNAAKVAELQKRADELSREGVPPLIVKEMMSAARRELLGSTSIPLDGAELEGQP